MHALCIKKCNACTHDCQSYINEYSYTPISALIVYTAAGCILLPELHWQMLPNKNEYILIAFCVILIILLPLMEVAEYRSNHRNI